jgi:hypothetical protein
MDPFGHHPKGAYDTVESLSALAAQVQAARPRFTLASAFEAAEAGQLPIWVGDFLASHGSDNATLAAGLAMERHWWLGPVRLPVDQLERQAGPEDDVPCPIDTDEWEDDVDGMRSSLEEGWQPPPVLVELRDGRLVLEDGNHRYEALRREGASRVWAIVWGDDPADRDRLRQRHA